MPASPLVPLSHSAGCTSQTGRSSSTPPTSSLSYYTIEEPPESSSEGEEQCSPTIQRRGDPAQQLVHTKCTLPHITTFSSRSSSPTSTSDCSDSPRVVSESPLTRCFQYSTDGNRPQPQVQASAAHLNRSPPVVNLATKLTPYKSTNTSVRPQVKPGMC